MNKDSWIPDRIPDSVDATPLLLYQSSAEEQEETLWL